MKTILKKILAGTGNKLLKISHDLNSNSGSEFQKEVNRWFKDNGDKSHRLNYDLNENSVVFDLGGYEGQWTSDIYSRYNCNIYVFEVLNEFYDIIKIRFARNQKIKVFPFGLANADKTEKISVMADKTSMFREGSNSKEIKLVEASGFIEKNSISKIDLMKINIEGGEFDLLSHLLDTGQAEKIVNIQVQFHDIIPNAEARMREIQQRLSKTHRLTYQYKFVWENWLLKS